MAGLDGFFSNVGGAVSDLYAAKGYGFKAQGFRLQAQGDEIEKQNYLKAGEFADENVQYAMASTAIKQQQEDRQNLKLIGGQQADVAGAGFAATGSALDLLRDSASQGALAKQVLGFQGQITEAGYQEQGRALRSQAEAAGIAEQQAGVAAQAADEAQKGAKISAIIHGVAAAFSFSGLNMGPGGGGGGGGVSPDGT